MGEVAGCLVSGLEKSRGLGVGVQAFVGAVSGEVAREETLESLWKRKEWVLVLSFPLNC